MYVNIRDLVIKYSLVFISIFFTLFVGSIHLLLMFNSTHIFGIIHFTVLLVLSFLIFFSFLFFKLLKFNISLLKLMQMQAQIDEIRQKLQSKQNDDEEFIQELKKQLNNNKKE